MELMIVVSIGFIAASMLIMNVQNATRGVRLTSTSASYANLLQQARIRAVRDDKYYRVLMATDQSTGNFFAFVDINQTGSFVEGDPRVMFGEGVIPQPYASGPGLTNLIGHFLPAGTSATINSTATGPVFGPRGLPCKPVTTGGFTTCPFLTPTSYVTFLQNVESGKWMAVTVTPAGRIREWQYDAANWSGIN
jgi:type II secretory pathway pseudopilin PulG